MRLRFVHVRMIVTLALAISINDLTPVQARGLQEVAVSNLESSSVQKNVEPVQTWTESDMVPVRRLVMYNIGVSEVLHFGPVDGNARLKFRVPNENVDDLLKSFVFRDEAGGALTSIQYRSAPSLAELAARDFQSPVTLAQLLQMQRGQEIVMEQAGGEIRGVIWGVEDRTTNGNSVETLVVWVNEQLKSYDLAKLDSIRFASPTVQQKMKLSMIGLAEKGSSEQMQELQLLVAGQGQRQIGFGYVVDSTLWRMTYRLNVDETTGNLQGWAHIDNSTGQDWNDVDLELRTGRPAVFSADLFEPVLATRPGFGLEVFDLPPGLSITSPWLKATLNRRQASTEGMMGGAGGGYGSPGDIGMGGGMSGGMGGGGFGIGGATGMGGYAGPSANHGVTREEIRGFMQENEVAPRADAERWTSEVRYRVQTPVNLKSGESAAIPVMSFQVPCRFFSQIDLTNVNDTTNSDQVIEIRNNSHLPFLGGPLTLQQKGEFLGDVVLGRMDVGSSESLAYAQERSLSAQFLQPAEPNRLIAVQMAGRSVVTDWRREFNGRLTVTNSDSLPRATQVKLKFNEWAELESPTIQPAPKILDKETGIGTYELDVLGNQTATLKFTMAGTTTIVKSLENLTPHQVQSYLNNTDIEIDLTSRETMQTWLALQTQIRESTTAAAQVLASKKILETRLSEIRRDIELLRFDETLVAPLIEQLKQSVAEKQATTNRYEELSQQTIKLQEQLTGFYASLEVTR